MEDTAPLSSQSEGTIQLQLDTGPLSSQSKRIIQFDTNQEKNKVEI